MTAGVIVKPDCSRVLCARPLCANPQTPRGQCCPSCAASGCPLKGCVNILGNGEVRWQPNPCTTCQCLNNQPLCAAIACRPLTRSDCFGKPVVTPPWQCCPSCDFGVPRTKCRAVPEPFSQRNITVTADGRSGSGPKSCYRSVRSHSCDKEGFRARGKTFRCTARVGKRPVRFGKTCPLYVGVYRDVVRCKPVRDDNIIVGCDFIV